MVNTLQINRAWAMPNHNTFSIAPIKELIGRYFSEYGGLWLDPFSRNSPFGQAQNMTTNDLDTNVPADSHMEALDFLKSYSDSYADGVLFDPPYSPRQISECYKSIGMEVGMKETQSALLYQRVRNAIVPLLTENAIVLSFGWNTVGMGKKRGFEIEEIMLCCHGGAHNDTICMAEKLNSDQGNFAF